MLKSLELKNIALIDEACVVFDEGLNVLSGETGSGKSVLIDSVNFVLGAKADKTMIRYGESKCSASAVFGIENNAAVKETLSSFGMDVVEDELIVTRTLSVDSKGTIRVNGVPFTAAMLKKVTAHLVDVHGQSEHFSLLSESEQLRVVDCFCDKKILAVKEKVASIVSGLKETDKILSSFGGSESERAIKADILKFQIDEIANADVKEGEEEELLSKRKRIQSAEKCTEAFSLTAQSLLGENGARDRVLSALRAMGQISRLDDKYDGVCERLKAVSEELEDIGETTEDFSSEFDFEPSEADRLEDRLDKIRSIKKKYGSDYAAVIAFSENAKAEYDKLVHYDEEYAKCNERKKSLLESLNKAYAELTAIRKQGCASFTGKVEKELRELGMKNAKFDVRFSEEGADGTSYRLNGRDRVEFLFSANLGEPTKPLSKIISGGEMSRFMLALKTVTSSYKSISTYIFDEIDSGISGQVARIVAEKFAAIALNTQVIAISHLPQICAMADASFLISKREEGGKTHTTVERLTDEKRVSEIVRMTGGVDSLAAREHAGELLRSAEEYKNNLR